MADEVDSVSAKGLRKLFRISSGAIRFKVKANRLQLWLVDKEKPNRKLYQIDLGCLSSRIENERSKDKTENNFVINENIFRELWLTWFDGKVCVGEIGQKEPLHSTLLLTKTIITELDSFRFKTTDPRLMKFRGALKCGFFPVSPLSFRKKKQEIKKLDGGELYWVKMTNQDKVPHKATVGGYDNEPTYIVRALHNHSLCPGRYIPSQGKAFLPWGFSEHIKTNFEILCGFNLEWVVTKGKNIPKNAFIAGYSEVRNEPLYIGRAMIDGNLISGKVHVMYKTCYLPYHGREVEVQSYEILVQL